MRKFATEEIIRQKCSICGSKNKTFTEVYKNKIGIGYMLTCCDCGHVDTFLGVNMSKTFLTGGLQPGKEACVCNTVCYNEECPYYKKENLGQAIEKINNTFDPNRGNKDDSNENHIIGGNTGLNFYCNTCVGIGNLSQGQLNVNEIDIDENPKFH